MEEGFIKIHRKIWKNAISTKPIYFSIWIYLLSHANYEDKDVIINNRKFTIKRGSFLGSISKIAKHFNISTGTTTYVLRYLILEKMIEKSSTFKFTLFTILNYDEYQKVERKVESKLKANEKQIESKLKQLIIYKKDKNNKKDKNIITEDDQNWIDLLMIWIDYRTKIKKPLKEISYKSAYDKLCKLSNGNIEKAREIIGESIANGWQGLFPLKETKNKINNLSNDLKKNILEGLKINNKGEEIC